ncbi:MAG: cyclic nucleotide-binding domain-containing protein [Acidobacteriota bacterium]|nr:cyclic nucleotide-binding domain-containing protein [Acidobacteriota bacterium]MDH3785200.1 cyclic nucleotide-binding domain-containing protein [Acidobacteriota bacterium]
MVTNTLGRVYAAGEAIVSQGEKGSCMYVIQSGSVDVIDESGGQELRLAQLKTGDFFGEMAIFEHEVRSATVRAHGEARVLTIDRRTLMQRIQSDPTLAFNLLKTLSHRIRLLDAELKHGKRRG